MVEFYRDAHTKGVARTEAGLRSFMLGVYAYLGAGLLLSAMCAWVATMIVANNIGFFFFSTAGRMIHMLFALVFPLLFLFASEMSKNSSASFSKMMYWGYVACLGASLSFFMMIFASAEIFMALLLTATAFTGLCLYGYSTNRNLTSIGVFSSMLGIGLLVMLLINVLFVQSSAFDLFISFGFLFFASVATAWNNQNLKLMYYQTEGIADSEFMTKLQVRGAWSLFASFYLIFINLLRIMSYRG